MRGDKSFESVPTDNFSVKNWLITESNMIKISEATPQDLHFILENIRANKRQSMNIRKMSGLKLYVLKSQENILGWIGLSMGHFAQYAEYFSLFVLPEHRGRGLGLLLELQVVETALRENFKQLHFRVDSASSRRLFDIRLQSKEMKIINPEENLKKMCHQCELFKTECQEQVFFVMDLEERKNRLQREVSKFPTAQSVTLL